MKIKVLTDGLVGFSPDQIVDVPDRDGVPLSRYWRKRLAENVGCEVYVPVEVPVVKRLKSKAKSKAKDDSEVLA